MVAAAGAAPGAIAVVLRSVGHAGLRDEWRGRSKAGDSPGRANPCVILRNYARAMMRRAMPTLFSFGLSYSRLSPERFRAGAVRTQLRCRVWLLIAALLVASACVQDSRPVVIITPTPDAADVAPEPSPVRFPIGARATPTLTAAAIATPEATPEAPPEAPPEAAPWRITNTDGTGVAVRDACADSRRISAPGSGLKEGVTVVPVPSLGIDGCRGWALVRADDGRESWIRLRYLTRSGVSYWPDAGVPRAWGDVITMLSAAEQTCVARELDSSQFAVALATRVGATRPGSWVASFLACLQPDTVLALGSSTALRALEEEFGPLPDDASQCVRQLVDEALAIDRTAFLSHVPSSVEAEAVMGELTGLCLRGSVPASAEPASG